MNKIIKKFDENTELFAKDAVLEAKNNKDKIKKQLLSSVKDYSLNVEKYRDEEIPMHIIYAIILLAEFKEKELFPILINIYSQDYLDTRPAMDYCITDILPRIIISVFNGDFASLNKLIENKKIKEYSKAQCLRCYIYFYDNKLISQQDLKKLIKYYDYKDNDIYNTIMEVIINTHLFNLIEDVKTMFDYYLIDYNIRGGYAEFIDGIFDYDDDLDKFEPIEDTIKEMSWWACFKNKESQQDYKKIEKQLQDKIEKEIDEVEKFTKVGRNDPCPCGSGKKYKKCCLNNPDKRLPYQKYIDDSWKKYPKRKNRDDILDIYDFYQEEYVEIDKLLYKAIKKKNIPLFIERDKHKEMMINLNYLEEAFEKIKQVVAKNNFSTVNQYDEVASIHFSLYVFFEKYSDLLENLIEKDTDLKKIIYLDKLEELLKFFYDNFDLNDEYEEVFINKWTTLFYYTNQLDKGINYMKDKLKNCIKELKIPVYRSLFDLTLCKYDDMSKIDALIKKEKDKTLKKELLELKKDFMYEDY